MAAHNLILIEKFCLHYKIENTFIYSLVEIGLIDVKVYDENKYIYQDEIGDIEIMIRLHNDLKVNMEGIDIVFNLLQKEKKLKKELNALQNRLRLYENE